MAYPLLTVLGFVTVCFFLGFPIARLLLSSTDRKSQFFLAPILGFSAIIILIEPLIHVFGPLSSLAPVLWGLVLLSMSIEGLRLWQSRFDLRNEQLGRIALVALGFAVIYAGLIAAPLVYGINFAIFRTNPSDANVNIAIADLWVNTPWHLISSYINALGTPGQAQSTTELLATSPIGIFSARFVRFDVRLATGMMIGLQSVLFALPTYLVYLPFQLVALMITAGGFYGMMRAAGAARWVSIAVCISLLGGWSYIIRESDNSNQLTVLPMMAGALYLILLRFDVGSLSGWRPAAALALVLSSAVTTYPEIGMMFGACIVGALVLRGLLKRAERSHWTAVATTAGITGAILFLNGQARGILRWFNFLRSGGLKTLGMSGPTDEFLLRDGVAGALGIYRWDLSAILDRVRGISHWIRGEFIFWIIFAIIAVWIVFVLIRGLAKSYIGLAISFYTFLMIAIGVNALIHQDIYVVGRSTSFLGMILLAGCGLTFFAGFQHEPECPRAIRFNAKKTGSIILTLWTLATLPLWWLSFTRFETGYSTIISRNPKSNILPVPKIEAVISERNRGGLAVYLPPATDNSVPWPAFFYMHLLCATKDAAFLSGFMNDNRDSRLGGQLDVYLQPKWRDKLIDQLLVWTQFDPVPISIHGDLIASDHKFRLYSIKPIRLSELSGILKQ